MGKPRNKTQELQDKGRESRQRVLDYFAEMMRATNNPIDADQMRELTATWLYFPEGRKLAEKIDALYGDKPELHRAVLLGAIIALINRLLA
jgi:DNA-binding PadR family transcriptional regulator